MKTIKQLFFGAAILLFATTSCIDNFTIRGNGVNATDGRITNNFEKVKSSGDFDVHITNGDELEVVVSAEQNIIPYIETYVSGNTLNIDIRGMHNIKNSLPMEVFVTLPHLEGLKLSGSGVITTDYFYSDNFDINISGSGYISAAIDVEKVDASVSGSGKLELAGVASNADFDISGSGKIDAYDLALSNCDAKISGSGDMWVNVEQNLYAKISGSGTIFYYGNPSIESHISGSGKLIHDN